MAASVDVTIKELEMKEDAKQLGDRRSAAWGSSPSETPIETLLCREDGEEEDEDDEEGAPVAAALANRRLATGTAAIGLFRQSFNIIIRSLNSSSAAPPPSSAAVAASGEATDPTKPKRRKKKNLFEVAQFLPNWGLGYKMAKSHWRDVSYEITKVNLYKDGRHGKAWGIRHKAGLAVADAPVKISGVHKRGWKYIPEAKKRATDDKKAVEAPTPAQDSVA